MSPEGFAKKQMYYNYDPFILGMDNPRCPPVMQFTGLKDKNSKEIYEGDIVNKCVSAGRFIKYEVVFKAECSGFRYKRFNSNYPSESNRFEGHRGKAFNAEIIGNIYENPELLVDKQ